MNKITDLVKVASESDAVSFLKELLRGAEQFSSLFATPSKVFQAAMNIKYTRDLSDEFEELLKQSKIKEDYQRTSQYSSCLQELLASLENPPVDQKKFNVLKAIFLKAAKEEISNRDNPMPQLLMNIAKDLNGGDILLLEACFRHSEERHFEYEHEWPQYIADRSALKSPDMVELYRENLVSKKLYDKDRNKLSHLGNLLCRFFIKEENTN